MPKRGRIVSAKDRETIYNLRYKVSPPVPFRKIHEEYLPEIPLGTLYRIAREEYTTKGGDEAHAEIPEAPPEEDRQEGIEFTQTGEDTAVAIAVGQTIRTLEDLLEAAQVDLTVWTVKDWTANAWGQAQKNADNPRRPILVTLHQVKAYLTRRLDVDYSQKIADMREEIRTLAPVFRPPADLAKRQTGSKALELAIPDLHFGRLIVEGQTNDRGYTPEAAQAIWTEAVTGLMSLAPLDEIELFIIPLGNDLFNVDNLKGQTTHGTQVGPPGSLNFVYFRMVRTMVRETIDQLAAYAPVIVPIVPGNHDRETVYYLGEALYDWYHNTPTVTILNGPRLRKYYTYGRNLIGWTHGQDERHADLPMIMAQEAGDAWATATWREWHIGHLHRKRETKYLSVNEIGGVRIRVIPSLASIDDWHYLKGYVTGLKAAEAYLWDKDRGPVAIYNYTPDLN